MSDCDIPLDLRNTLAQIPNDKTLPSDLSAVTSAEPHLDEKSRLLLELIRLVFSFSAMLGAILVGAVFVVSGRTFVVDPDVWWHIKVGRDILTNHHWPTTDPYSFTVSGQPWIAYEWFAEIIWAVAHRVGGLRGMDVLLVLLGSAVILALYYFATLRCRNSKAGFIAVALLFPLASVSFSLRPQMIGYLFLVITLIAMERFRQGMYQAAWFLPVMFLLWVNTHGSFIIGLGVVFLYWISGFKDFRLGGIEACAWSAAERTRLGLVFLLCLAVLPLTPYGTKLAVYPFDMAFGQPVNVANILEWQTMPFGLPGGKIFLALVLLFFVLQVVFRFTWRVEELALFLFGMMMACLHVRFVLLFVPFFAPLLATMLARWVPGYDRAKDLYIFNGVLMAAIATALVAYFPSQSSLKQAVAKTFPLGALEYLQQNPIPRPMFDTYGFGGYLVYTGQKVFIDGRGDVYERGGVLSDYARITNIKPGALAILQSYGIRSCLLGPDEPLATLLAASPDWRRVYVDSVSVVYVNNRTVPPTRQE
jgi:hypothetical protein